MNVVKRLLALRFKPGKGTTTTALLTLPFVVVILLFVVGPALGLASSSTRSTATGQTSTTGTTGQTGTTTADGSTSDQTSTTDTTTACGTTTGETTTTGGTTTGGATTTGGTTTTGPVPTGQTSTTGETTTGQTSTTGEGATTDQTTTAAGSTDCAPPPPCPTDQTGTGATTTGTDTTTTSLTPTTGQSTTTGQTSTTDTTTTDMTQTGCTAGGVDANSPAAKYSVLNATVNVATDHERLGSSAFPNYTNGAVDNYYSMAHAHVDGSPFAEGTASPADSGPIGQTAAAGNAQQPQYADARWPGDTGNASFGNQGGPYGVAQATDYSASAEAEEASSAAGAPTGSTMIAAPKGFNGRLKTALAKWKAKWLGRLHMKRRAPTPALPAPAVTIPTTPKPPTLPKLTTPAVTVPGVATVPSATVPTVTVPSVTVPPVPPPPTVSVPSLKGPQAAPAPSRSLAAASGSTTGTSTTTDTTTTAGTTTGGTTTGSTTTTGTTTTNPSPAPDGGSVLKSTSKAELDPQTNALVTTGESSLGLVSVGSGQIVFEGIHVLASITNTGSKPTDSGDSFGFGSGPGTTGTTTTGGTTTSPLPAPSAPGATTTTGTTTTGADDSGNSATYKVSVRVAAASIGGVPVTIDQDGVHVAGQGSALPYQQASDALNSALAQAGIRIALVGPEIKTNQGEETIDATGVHVYFTQPLNAPGAPAQYAEHILGEVYVDSLAVLAQPLAASGFGGLGSGFGGGKAKPGAATKPTSGKPAKTGGTGTAATHTGGTPVSGSTSSGAFPSGGGVSGSAQPEASSSFGSPSLPSGPTGSAQSSPSGFVSTIKKPVWMLVAFLIWLALSGATGWSLWKWHREETP